MYINYLKKGCLGATLLIISMVSSSQEGALKSANHRYVNLAVPINATPQKQIFVLNEDSSKQVAYWTTVVYKFPNIETAPSPYLNLKLTPGEITKFNMVVPSQNSATGYVGCSLTFDKNGIVQQTATDACKGLVPISNELKNSPVTAYVLGADFGNPVKVDSKVLKPLVAARAIERVITFINNSNYDVCLINQHDNPDAAPTTALMCGNDDRYQTLISNKQKVDFVIPPSGLNSAAWIVAGYRPAGTKEWLQTGFVNPGRHQAATKFELTMYPYYEDGVNAGPIKHSVGPTNIDVSLVDGANLTYRIYPKTSVNSTPVCTKTNDNVSPTKNYIGVYTAKLPIAYFKNINNDNKFSCSSDGARYDDASCASPCTMAYVNQASQDIINQTCCIGAFGTKDSCTASSNPNNPVNSAYTALIHKQFVNSYSFAYDDAKADFTCDPFASYVFEINGVGKEMLVNN